LSPSLGVVLATTVAAVPGRRLHHLVVDSHHGRQEVTSKIDAARYSRSQPPNRTSSAQGGPSRPLDPPDRAQAHAHASARERVRQWRWPRTWARCRVEPRSHRRRCWRPQSARPAALRI